jgi:type III secretory pathway lipoprotein EscJ
MGFQKIFEDRQEVRAEIIKGVLHEHQINAVIVPKKDSSYQFGFFEVHVEHDDVMKSIKIIEEEIKFE